MTKRNFDEQKKRNFEIIYNFVIKESSVVVFDINILANSTLIHNFMYFAGKLVYVIVLASVHVASCGDPGGLRWE